MIRNRRDWYLAVVMLALLLLIGCGRAPGASNLTDSTPAGTPEVPELGSGVRFVLIDHEEYLGLSVGELPPGVTVQVDGHESTRGYQEDPDMLLLRKYDLLREQNPGDKRELSVQYKVLYYYQGEVIREKSCSLEVQAQTFLAITPMLELTSFDYVPMHIETNSGAVVHVNGEQVAPVRAASTLYHVPLPLIGHNRLVVTAHRPGEQPGTWGCDVIRRSVLSMQELREERGDLEYAASVDSLGVFRPLATETMQTILQAVPGIVPQPLPVTEDEIGYFTVGSHGKEGVLRLFKHGIVADSQFYPLSAEVLGMLNGYLTTPFGWVFERGTADLLPGGPFRGPGVRMWALRRDRPYTETGLFVYDEDSDPQTIERIVEISPGRFEVHVTAGVAEQEECALIRGWDDQRQFTVKKQK